MTAPKTILIISEEIVIDSIFYDITIILFIFLKNGSRQVPTPKCSALTERTQKNIFKERLLLFLVP